MRIAVDALGIHYYGGGRTATLNLFETLLKIDKDNEYLFFLTEHEPSLYSESGRSKQIISPMKNRFLVRIWVQLIMPISVRDFDLIHFAKHLGVFKISSPSVVTIFDMTTLVHPELFPLIDVWYWRHLQPRTLLNAENIIAISKNTAKDVAKFYPGTEDKLRVIYPAIGTRFHPIQHDQISDVRSRYKIPEKYLIHIGRIDKKKNLTFLVKAFDIFKKSDSNEIKLVFVGEDYPKSPDLELRPTIDILGLEDDVIFTGQIPDQDIPALYSGALATLFPSIHEGFGLAPIEAMASGSPVVGHMAGAFKEVAGDAALIVDSQSEDSFASALSRVVNDQELRHELIERGISRAGDFEPFKTATQTLRLYEEIHSA
jgi:glycosyltransferase involved in cell wall biosynthesis